MDMSAGQGKEVKPVDGSGKVDALAVKSDMSLEEVRDLWRKGCDWADDLPIGMIRRNDTT
jgi:hypothetical protein